jgi:general secretion pathway protein G
MTIGKARKFVVKPTDRRGGPAPRNGFTLIEILLVLVMLAVIALIALPQFSDASDEARQSALAKDLRMVRDQIALFKLQHGGVLPGQGGRDMAAQLTGKTDVKGDLAANGAYGPYMRVFPTNPFTDTSTVRSAAGGSPGVGSAAWFYNTKTGQFFPNDVAHKDM